MKKFLIGLGVIVVVVVLLLVTGALKFSVRVGPPQPLAQPAAETAAATKWRTYANKDFGYLISYPPDWILRENTGSSSRDILLTQPGNLGFVRIMGILDPAVNSEDAMRASLQAYKDSFATKPDEVLAAFKSDIQGAIAGFMAAGKMRLNNQEYIFKERGLMSTKGRVLIMRGAAVTEQQKEILPVADKIMDSFQAAQQ